MHKRIRTEISPDILDTIGKSFKFRHGKGVAEWLKNSLDSYLRLRAANQEPRKGAWPVMLDLIDGDKNHSGPNLALIDFGGTSFGAVKDFFLRWGDTSAATHGNRFASANVTGGHGNGGKFYMREMWKNGARFATWREGRFTSLVVDRGEKGTTGFWEAQDEECSWRDALGKALPVREGLREGLAFKQHLEGHDKKLIAELDADKRGFSVVVGRGAEQLWSSNDVVKGRRWDHQRLVDEIRAAAQARRPIRELTVSVLINGVLALERLTPEDIETDPDWPERESLLPGRLLGVSVRETGKLTLRKAAHQLVGRLRDHNAISVLDGDGNPLASYRTAEVPGAGSSLASFMFGDLVLDFPGLDDLIENDREKLVRSGRSEKILEWVGEQLSQFVSDIEEAERKKKKQSELDVASVLNDALNKHAQRFLEEIQTEIMVNYVEDPAGGGPGPAGVGSGAKGDGPGGHGKRGSGGKSGDGGTNETEGNDSKSKRRKFPRVLLSGFDDDPANPGETKPLTKAHPPLWQDDSDRKHNVYWINTEHPFAQETLKHGGSKGHAFKSHQLYMFRDVVQREALRMLQKREAEIAIDRMETELDDFSNRFLGELPYELIMSLLEEDAAGRKPKAKRA